MGSYGYCPHGGISMSPVVFASRVKMDPGKFRTYVREMFCGLERSGRTIMLTARRLGLDLKAAFRSGMHVRERLKSDRDATGGES